MARKPSRKTVDNGDGTRSIVGRNANGDGSIYWDASKDRWRATYQDPTTGRRRSVLGRDKADAADRRDRKLADLQAAAPSGVLGQNPTVAQLGAWFLDHVADVRPGTLNTYRKHVAVIDRHLGQVHVRDVSIEQLRIFMTDLRDEYADATASNVRARLRQILEEAVTLGYLPTNPVTKVKAPQRTRERTPKTVLTVDQVQKLIAACAGHPLGAAVAALYLLGNRASEVLGLAWNDIERTNVWNADTEQDEPRWTASVRRGSTYLSRGKGRRGGMVLGPTKTVGTQGTIELPPTLVQLLQQRELDQQLEREMAGPAWATHTYEGEALDMVFTDRRGRLMLYHRLRDAVTDCCESAGIDPRGVATHTGRRTVITALYTAGLDLSDVARFVGHTQPSTTAGYVQHLGNRPATTAALARDLLDPGV